MVNGELHIFMDRSMFFDSDFYGYRNIMEGVLLFEMFGIILATLNRRRHLIKIHAEWNVSAVRALQF